MNDKYNIYERLIGRFLRHKEILCADLEISVEGKNINKLDKWEVTLNVGYDEDDYADFRETLNRIGYANDGTIWFQDGSWLGTSNVYDDAFGDPWVYHERPKIPEELK
jgi:hypothetical protein